MHSTLATVFLIFVIAVASPMVSDALGSARVSAVVVEVIGGLLIGPALLGIAEVTPTVNGLADIGLAFLMFLAGFEIDFARVRGRPLRLAAVGWVVSAVLGVAIGLVAAFDRGAASWTVIGLALASTALSMLVPLWRDDGLLDTRFGVLGQAAGVIGELGPIVALSVLLTDTSALRTALVLVAFAAVTVAAALAATRNTPSRVLSLLRQHTHTTSQLPVRVTALLLVGLLWLAGSFGVDVLLGAFAAGIIVRLGSAGLDLDVLSGKFDAIGYGVLIPIFFVVSGMRLDADELFHDPAAWLRVPLFVAGFLVVRGAPVFLFYRNALPAGLRVPFALFSATALPLVVVIVELGVDAHLLDGVTAAALEVAALVSVILFPALGFRGVDRHPELLRPAP